MCSLCVSIERVHAALEAAYTGYYYVTLHTHKDCRGAGNLMKKVVVCVVWLRQRLFKSLAIELEQKMCNQFSGCFWTFFVFACSLRLAGHKTGSALFAHFFHSSWLCSARSVHLKVYILKSFQHSTFHLLPLLCWLLVSHLLSFWFLLLFLANKINSVHVTHAAWLCLLSVCIFLAYVLRRRRRKRRSLLLERRWSREDKKVSWRDGGDKMVSDDKWRGKKNATTKKVVF